MWEWENYHNFWKRTIFVSWTPRASLSLSETSNLLQKNRRSICRDQGKMHESKLIYMRRATFWSEPNFIWITLGFLSYLRVFFSWGRSFTSLFKMQVITYHIEHCLCRLCSSILSYEKSLIWLVLWMYEMALVCSNCWV